MTSSLERGEDVATGDGFEHRPMLLDELRQSAFARGDGDRRCGDSEPEIRGAGQHRLGRFLAIRTAPEMGVPSWALAQRLFPLVRERTSHGFACAAGVTLYGDVRGLGRHAELEE